MSAFYDRKYDVLLSTTIVESGLDIPSANTLIVHRADRFGLAQLYQLRGRVGRSKTRAYAYLTMPADRIDHRGGDRSGCRCWPTSTASAPASSSPATTSTSAAPAICSATSSPGHIKEVGFELYQSMLEDAIVELKAGGDIADAKNSRRRSASMRRS